MVTLRYVVTGTGRCGTVGLAAALTSVGIPCSHERFFNGNNLEEALRRMETNGGENSLCSKHCGLPGQRDQVIAESSYLGAPYLGASCFAATTIIHAVRDPWKVILSFLNNIQFFRGEPEHEHERFIYSVLPQLHEMDNPVDRAVYYYIRWNRLIETLARSRWPGRYILHHIEDGPKLLLRKLGLTEDLIGLCQMKEDVNSFKEWPGELRDLVPPQRMRFEQINASNYASELRKLAKRYGYEAPSREEAPVEPVSDKAAPGSANEIRFAQVPRSLEAGYRSYNLVRWRTDCYALPQGEKPIDLEATTEDLLRELVERGEVVIARCLSELKAKVDEVSRQRIATAGRGLPALVESGYRCFNLVFWGSEYYALHQQSLEGFALETAGAHALKESMDRGIVLVAPSLREVREKVDQVVRKHPELEEFKPFWEISGYAE
jgi:hypothetical protein